MKRKLKKKVKNFFFVILFLFILVFLIFTFIKPEQKENKVVEINYVLEILKMENNVFEKEFLEWVDDNYDNVLKKLFDSLKNNTYTDNFWHSEVGYSYKVVNDLYNGGYGEIDNVMFDQENKEVATIGFAGDVSLADNWTIMPKYKSRNQGVLGILSQNMINYMSSLDWMNVNSEFAFSNRGVAMAGKQYTFRANPVHANIYHEMGVDMVSLANNHVYDYGQEAFYDTLSTLQNYKIPYIGAGVNKEEAERAYYLIVNGYKISFLNATRAEKYILTPEAQDNSPGVFRCYDTTRLVERIKEEKEKSDYVIVIVHWGKETYHTLEQVQLDTGKVYIDSGADMVVGHHAHVLQGMEFYKGKLIAYNLGNFIFNAHTVDTGILKWELDKNGESKYYFYPGIQSDSYTREANSDEAKRIYNNMTSWSINVNFLEDGQIVERVN